MFILQLVEEMDPKAMKTQVLIRVLAKKPGWKDTNFQVRSTNSTLGAVLQQNFTNSFKINNQLMFPVKAHL